VTWKEYIRGRQWHPTIEADDETWDLIWNLWQMKCHFSRCSPSNVTPQFCTPWGLWLPWPFSVLSRVQSLSWRLHLWPALCWSYVEEVSFIKMYNHQLLRCTVPESALMDFRNVCKYKLFNEIVVMLTVPFSSVYYWVTAIYRRVGKQRLQLCVMWQAATRHSKDAAASLFWVEG